jgi:hypothetical protein
MPSTQVRTEPRARSYRAPEPQEGLLDDVLGGVARSGHAVGQREGGGRMTVVDDLERLRVAATHELHQVLVGELRERHLRMTYAAAP